MKLTNLEDEVKRIAMILEKPNPKPTLRESIACLAVWENELCRNVTDIAEIIRQLWEERQNSIPIARLDEMVGKVESLKQARNYKSKENNLRYENMINYGIGEWNKAIEAAINAIKQEIVR